MTLKKVWFWGYECLRCLHRWVPRGIDALAEKPPKEPEKPRVCPRCKSPYWDRPLRKEPD